MATSQALTEHDVADERGECAHTEGKHDHIKHQELSLRADRAGRAS
jgi:hypothetical protein